MNRTLLCVIKYILSDENINMKNTKILIDINVRFNNEDCTYYGALIKNSKTNRKKHLKRYYIEV